MACMGLGRVGTLDLVAEDYYQASVGETWSSKTNTFFFIIGDTNLIGLNYIHSFQIGHLAASLRFGKISRMFGPTVQVILLANLREAARCSI